MPLLGYEKWERFTDAIERARAAAENQGHAFDDLFVAVTEKPEVLPGSGKNLGGRPREDFHLARFAVYLVAMNGDPRKPEIAAAQSYFATKTREAEVRPALTGAELLAHAVIEAQAMLVAKDEQIKELTPPARSWMLLADAAGDFSVSEAAKILSRDPSITTGRDRLFDYMAEIGWIFRSKNSRGGWEAYQTQVNTGRLVEKPAKPFLNSKTGSYELPAPTIRVTAKGIGKLHELMGGTGELQFVTGVSA